MADTNLQETTAIILADEILDEYLEDLDIDNPPSPKEITTTVVNKIRKGIKELNKDLPKTERWSIPQSLDAHQIAKIMLKLYHIINVKAVSNGGTTSDPEMDMLAIYQTDGPDNGIYATNDSAFRSVAKQYNSRLNKNSFAELITDLQSEAPRKEQCSDKNLIPVNNGIFNYETKQLMFFDPEYVFITKSRTNYNPNATNVIIHNDADNTDWDVESWMNELSDDKEIVNLLWEIIGASVRPYERWNKAAFLFSMQGNNGKGTLCQLIRNLCGTNNCVNIPLSDFSKDYALSEIIGKIAIITDENDVNVYIDKAANLKAIITNDAVTLTRKYKSPISYQFFGFMIQCMNSYPKIKDKTNSFYRRQLFVPFTKCFTGQERSYIKNDYINRPEILEYVLYRVLNMNYHKFSEPKACRTALEDYKMANDPLRQFIDEIFPELVWDFVPFNFLYSLYKVWYKNNVGNLNMQGRNKFIQELVSILPEQDEWYCTDPNLKIRTGNKINKPEPLIAEYNLTDWMNPNYKGSDINKICIPVLKPSYRGILKY